MTHSSIPDSPAHPGPSRAPTVAFAAGLGTVAVGLTVMAGWILDIDGLRRFLPGVTNPMVGTTAACFVLLGSALLLLRASDPSIGRRRAARALALVAIAVGLLVLSEYVFGWDSGQAQFLYRSSALPFTGAMAVPTAITFVMLGSALIAMASRHRRGPLVAQTLTLVGVVAPLLGLVGRAYGVQSLSSYLVGTVVMALHTALTFVTLGVGILAARPHHGVVRTFTDRQPGGWLLRTLLIPAWGVVFFVGMFRLLGEHAGFYGTEFGTSLFTMATILLLGVLMLVGARSLNRSEARRLLTEGKLLESEHRGQSVLASLGEGVVTVDASGVITSVNPAVERMTGWAPDEVIGRHYEKAFPLSDRAGNPQPQEEQLLDRAMATRELAVSRGYDTTLTTKSGEHVPVAITASPIFDEHGRVIGGVDVLRDVSHEREVDIMKSSLISTVSHELRTPLTMITGFSELLLNRPLDPGRAKEAAGQIHESALRLDRLVEDLLSVSRIDSGSLVVRREHLDLPELVQELAATFTSERPIELELDTDAAVIADRDMVHRILTNLVSNAVKYSPGGGPVRIAVSQGGASAVISVTDSGIGMSADERSRLFEKFFRADRPEVRNARGTGLGLYITRNLVELQGGTIAVDSTPGEGTTFTFTLPMAKERVTT